MKTHIVRAEKIILTKKIKIESSVDVKVVHHDKFITIENDFLNFKIKINLMPFYNDNLNPLIFNDIVKEYERFNNLPDNFLFGSRSHNAAFFRALLAYILFYNYSYKKTIIGKLFTKENKMQRKICHATVISYIKNIENIIYVKDKPYYNICVKNIEYFNKKEEENEK